MNTEDRLRQLELDLAQLRAQMDRAPDREARLSHPRNPRLAKTCKQYSASGSYPTSPADTVYIQFLDATFTETEGDQTPTDTTRQADGAVLAHSRVGYIREGTIVLALFDNRRWWILPVWHQARWIEFVVNDESGFATTNSSVTVDGVTYHDGFEPASAVTTVYNKSASSDYIFEGGDDARGVALYSPAEDKYYIVQMECG